MYCKVKQSSWQVHSKENTKNSAWPESPSRKASKQRNRKIYLSFVFSLIILKHQFLKNYISIIYWFICSLKSIEISSVTEPMIHSKRQSLVHGYWQEENNKNWVFMCCRWVKKPKFSDVYVLFKHSNFCSRILQMHSKWSRFQHFFPRHAPDPTRS